MGGRAGGKPGALNSVFVKDPAHPWDHVPQTEQDANGLSEESGAGPIKQSLSCHDAGDSHEGVVVSLKSRCGV